jgi:hypothetical protein
MLDIIMLTVMGPQRVGWRAYAKVYPQSSQRAATTSFGPIVAKCLAQSQLFLGHHNFRRGATPPQGLHLEDPQAVLDTIAAVLGGGYSVEF